MDFGVEAVWAVDVAATETRDAGVLVQCIAPSIAIGACRGRVSETVAMARRGPHRLGRTSPQYRPSMAKSWSGRTSMGA
jgi:hypothetical protein